MPRILPSQEYLNDVLKYSSDKELYWRHRDREFFSLDRLWKAWNERYADKPALTSIDRGGYRFGSLTINGEKRLVRAHRVVWKMHYGTDPDSIDHIDGNRNSIDIINLRAADWSINARNAKRPINNSTGHIGVGISSNYINGLKRGRQLPKKYRSKIHVGNKHICLGEYETIEEAVKARKDAERQYNFHENHGR